MTDKYEFSFEFHTVGEPTKLIGILKLLKQLGDLGASRYIGVIEESGWGTWLFDGDGPDKIKNIEVKRIE